jgi:hypothetical protein
MANEQQRSASAKGDCGCGCGGKKAAAGTTASAAEPFASVLAVNEADDLLASAELDLAEVEGSGGMTELVGGGAPARSAAALAAEAELALADLEGESSFESEETSAEALIALAKAHPGLKITIAFD